VVRAAAKKIQAIWNVLQGRRKYNLFSKRTSLLLVL
jgi:hypothetical protein